MIPREKVIISCAITGSIHTPSMSQYLPVTPDEIAASAIGAAKAGAAIVHLHAREPSNGRPSADPAIFKHFLPKIRAESDVIINITTGGGQGMSIEDRTAAAMAYEPELCSLNMGSMNFGLYQMAAKKRDWQHDWEVPHLEKSRDAIFRNTFGDVEIITDRLGKQRGARFEFECYDVGHIYNLAHFLERGLVTAPLFVQFVLGIHGGIAAEPEHLMHMKTTADRALGDAYTFSVAAAGRAQYPLVTLAAILGGHVRVGLEDNLYLGKGKLAASNAETVTQIREILSRLSLDVATPDEARTMLATKGAAKTKI
jgi:uncharacterized protein (DUF849 family)